MLKIINTVSDAADIILHLEMIDIFKLVDLPRKLVVPIALIASISD